LVLGEDLMLRFTAFMASAILILSASACSDANGGSESLPPASDSAPTTEPTPSETTEPTQEPTDTVPTKGPFVGYTAEEIQAYNDALAVYKQMLTTAAKLRGIGKATPAARRAYAQVYRPGAWDDEWAVLQQLEQANAYTRGKAKVESARPTRVLLSDRGGSVSIRVCLNSDGIRVFQRGEGEFPQADNRQSTYAVVLDQVEENGATLWKITSADKGKKC
jgi:hypothetical protein